MIMTETRFCLFIHLPKLTVSFCLTASILARQLCKSFVLTGTCAFGPKCRYSHPEAARPTKMATTETGLETVEASPAKTATEAEEMVADAEAYINKVLYGPSQRRRLPVFKEICPSDN